MLDLKLLKGLTDRTAYNILKPKIPMDMISVHTKAVVAWIGLFYKTYPDAERVSPKQLRDYILLRNEGKEEDDGVQLAISLVDKLDTAQTPDTQSLYDTLLEMACAGEVGKLVIQYQQGMEVELVPKLQEVSTKYALLKGVNTEEPDSIESILDKLESHEGITFEGVPLFEEYTMPLQGGDSVLFAGRPDRGKTTWLSYLIPKACPSINRLYKGERGVLWLVNEGRADKILPRIYQGALGCTLDELYEMRHNGTLRQKFSEAIQAPDDFIKVLPFHGKTIQDLELLVQKYNPAMVVIDMVEHVGGIHLASKSETIGALWERLRTLALTYDYVSIGTAQISVEGSDNLYPTYEHLAYTKTAVQGYTDIIMMLGNRDVEGMENIRGISLPKNKAKVGGKTSYPRLEFMVDFDRCQFYQRETNLVD